MFKILNLKDRVFLSMATLNFHSFKVGAEIELRKGIKGRPKHFSISIFLIKIVIMFSIQGKKNHGLINRKLH